MVCSALLLDQSSGLLGGLVAPSLPFEARSALDGLPCAADMGSCGTAAHTNAPVLVSDTRTDRRWQKAPLQDFAVCHGIRSCWSMPVRDAEGTVLGTFAMSSPLPGPPDEADLQLLTTAAQLAGIAVQRARSSARLQEKDAALKRAYLGEDMGHIAAAIAHDFNHLLSIIKALTRLALDELPGGASENPDLVGVLQATDSASDLTRQLRSLACGEALQPEPTELGAVVRDIARLLDRTVPDGIELSVETRVPEAWVEASRISLEQIILNLAINAQEAMPTGGRLDILLDHDPACGAALLKISDTGTGLDPATRHRVFEPHFTTKSQGTGLGLSTCRGIVARLGGTLSYDETYEHGASFEVRLPTEIRPRSAASREAASIPIRVARVGRVLVVDDAVELRRVACRVLRRAGYSAVEAGSTDDALAVLEDDPGVEVVLTDLQLPVRSGLALAALARHRHPHLQVVLMSGHCLLQLDGPAAAETHFLAKPFSPKDLTRAVSAAFEVIDQRGSVSAG